ncbi:MAG: hypothetical protein ACKVII_13080 [Planctomycetales bacterium]|jgi:hypothetical protein
MGSRLTKQTVAMAILAICFTAAFPQRTTMAAGDQYGGSDDDIQMSVDYRWAGGSVGGYYPIRIALQNRGLSRELDIVFEPLHGNELPAVSRRISIDQNASASLTLLIPLAGAGNYGSLTVSHNGRELEKLQNTISLPDVDYEDSRPGILAISKTPLAMQPLEDAITSLKNPGHVGHGYGVGKGQDNQTIEPFRLPETWLAYSCVDLVALSMEVFDGLAETERAAMLDWTRAGGTLLIYSVGEPVSNSKNLAELTEADTQSAIVEWHAADPAKRTRIRVQHMDEHGNLIESSMESLIELPSDESLESTIESVLEEASEAVSKQATQNPQLKFTWSAQDRPFEIREFGQGLVIGFVNDPFSGTVQDWGWLLKSFPMNDLWQSKQLGVAGRMDNEEFLKFLIPGIRSVPVMAFLIFISVFTFVIGPLNYFVLVRKKKLNFLVVTIPAIAIVTSLFLFGYSALSHGFSVKSRVRSLTFIDQGNNKAVSTARLSLYAGMTPSTGLSFSPSTLVMPIRASGEEFESARTDWTDTQWLRSGWLRSRTRTQFLTRNVRLERGRLTVGAGTDDELPVTNGLEWAIESLIVTDQDGKAWFANDLAAGIGRPLKPISESDRQSFCKLMDRSTPANPEEIENERDIRSLSTNPFFSYRRHGHFESFHVSHGKMEGTITGLRHNVERGSALIPNTYYAIVKDAPAIEFGTEVDVVDSWHLVIGKY